MLLDRSGKNAPLPPSKNCLFSFRTTECLSLHFVLADSTVCQLLSRTNMSRSIPVQRVFWPSSFKTGAGTSKAGKPGAGKRHREEEEADEEEREWGGFSEGEDDSQHEVAEENDANNQAGMDEAVDSLETKAEDEGIKVVKIPRKPIPKFDVDVLLSERGLRVVVEEFPKRKFKGPGHEVCNERVLCCRLV